MTPTISTLANPIKFFQTFFSSDKFIADEREYFFPDPNDPDDPHISWTNNIISNIDRTAESYDLEYEVNVDWEEDDSVPGHPLLTPIKKEWRKKTKFFSEALGSILYEEVENSKELITEHLYQSANADANISNKKFWKQELSSISKIIENKPHFSKYQVCSDAIIALINFIDKKKNNPDNQFDKRKILAPKFYSELLNVVDEKENTLFADMQNAKTNLMMLAGGKLDLLPSLEFQWRKEASYYLLNQLRLYNYPTFTIRRLASTTKITFNGANVSETAISKGANDFKKNSSKLKYKIDQLIEDNITFEV